MYAHRHKRTATQHTPHSSSTLKIPPHSLPHSFLQYYKKPEYKDDYYKVCQHLGVLVRVIVLAHSSKSCHTHWLQLLLVPTCC